MIKYKLSMNLSNWLLEDLDNEKAIRMENNLNCKNTSLLPLSYDNKAESCLNI